MSETERQGDPQFSWVLLWGVATYAALYLVVPRPEWVASAILGLSLGSLMRARWGLALALVVYAVVWLGCHLILGPPGGYLWPLTYHEPAYVDLFKRTFPAGLHLRELLTGLVTGWGWTWLGCARLASPGAQKKLAWALLALTVGAFVWRAQHTWKTPMGRCPEPPDYGWTFDGDLYLKVIYQMRRGEGYFEATTYALEHDARTQDQAGPVGQTVRTPIPYWLLSWISPDYYFAMMLALIGLLMVLVHRGVTRSVGPLPALLSAQLIGAFYLYPAMNWLMVPDLWASVVGMLSLAALLNDWLLAAMLLGGLAGCCREIALLWPAVNLLAAASRHRAREFAGWLAVTAAVAGLDVMTYWTAEPWLGNGGLGAAVFHRTLGSTAFSLKTTYFGSIFLLGRDILSPWLVVLGLSAPLRRGSAPACLQVAGLAILDLVAFRRLGGTTCEYYSFEWLPFAYVNAAFCFGLGMRDVGPQESEERA